MQNLDFYYLCAQNFLCFGKEPVELDLSKFGNIILVRGMDLDRQVNPGADEEEQRKAANGVGKSSIAEILVYTLFGKTIKEKLSNDVVINSRNGKGLRTEVRWGKYRVVRCRKNPGNTLQIWESEDRIWDDSTEISLGGIPATQALIEKKIGLSYASFVNTVIFTDKNSGSFLECDTETKRKIVENLLSLSPYREYSETAKKRRNEYKEHIAEMAKNYDRLLKEAENCRDRITHINHQESQWKKTKQSELSELIKTIKAKKLLLEQSDTGTALSKYNEAQEEITELNDSLKTLQEKLGKVKTLNYDVQKRLATSISQKNELLVTIQGFKSNAIALQTQINSSKKTIASFENSKGAKCSTCLGVVSEKNYGSVVAKEKESIEEKTIEKEDLDEKLTAAQDKLISIQKNIDLLNQGIQNADDKIEEINNQSISNQRRIVELSKINKPSVGTDEKVIEGQINELKKIALSKKAELDGKSPYIEILKSAEQESVTKDNEVATKRDELLIAEKELPYYEFWVKAFGDAGIRKFIIDGIIPSLNAKVAFWLQYLIDGKIKLCFDNELNETIESNPQDGNSFVYHAMSNGEQRRLNLAVSQAFAHVMAISAGISPSLVFLDEVTSNIDPMGVEGVYNMIMEISKHKQVFVTTHDRDLLEILSGCETINLVKKDRFTTLQD